MITPIVVGLLTTCALAQTGDAGTTSQRADFGASSSEDGSVVTVELRMVDWTAIGTVDIFDYRNAQVQSPVTITTTVVVTTSETLVLTNTETLVLTTTETEHASVPAPACSTASSDEHAASMFPPFASSSTREASPAGPSFLVGTSSGEYGDTTSSFWALSSSSTDDGETDTINFGPPRPSQTSSSAAGNSTTGYSAVCTLAAWPPFRNGTNSTQGLAPWNTTNGTLACNSASAGNWSWLTQAPLATDTRASPRPPMEVQSLLSWANPAARASMLTTGAAGVFVWATGWWLAR